MQASLFIVNCVYYKSVFKNKPETSPKPIMLYDYSCLCVLMCIDC